MTLDRIAETAPHATARSAALAALVDRLRRGDAPVTVLSGPGGSGKSWLARTALDRAAQGGMLVGTGKYGEGDGQAALDPVMAALSQLVAGALRRLYDTQTGIASLADALGVDLEILLSAGLTVAGLDSRGTIAALGDKRTGSARIIAAALGLLRWLDRFDIACAVLIDDWRRAPAEAIDLIRALAVDRAARREGPAFALLLTQREAVSGEIGGGIAPFVVALGSLEAGEVKALLAERVGGVAQAQAVIDTLGAAMPHLPFDVLQVADGFAASGALEKVGTGWQVDPARAGGLAFDAAQRVAALDMDSYRVALAVALWGDSAPLPMLLAALAVPDATSAPLEAQGIVAIDGERIAFRHDRLRQAVLDRAAPDARHDLAGWIAERIVPGPSDSENEVAALNLRIVGGVEGVASTAWRDRFARGARSARGRGDAAAAGRFAEAALALREPEGDAQSDRLVLHEAVLAAADRNDPATEARARAVIATARSPDERSEDYAVGAVALRFAGQTEGAWRLACEGLRGVGITPPNDGSRLQILRAAARWWFGKPGRVPTSPPTDALPLDGFSGIAAAAASIGYHRNPRAAAVIGFQASLLARRETHGSAYWQSVDAFLFAALGDRAAAAAAGRRALACIDRQRVYRAASLYQAIFFGVHWAEPLARHRDRFRDITRIALAEGDAVTASYGWRIFIMSGWRSGASLPTLFDEAVEARNALRTLGESAFVEEMEAMVALLEAMTGRAPWSARAWRMDIPTRNHVIDLELANLAGDWGETVRRAAALVPLRRDYSIQVDSVVLRFQEALARLRCGMRPRRGDLRFLKRAAAMNPHDHAPKLRLIEAERMRLRRGPRMALPLYVEAVALAEAADSRLDAALALRCAGDVAREAGEEPLARIWQDRSATLLAHWGAVVGARVDVPVATPQAIAAADLRAAAAERADRAKTRLLIHAGHELRTPLQALQTLLDLDADGTVRDREARTILRSLKGVVDDLNLLSNLADDRVDVARGVDLAELVRSEIALWRDANIVLNVDGEPIASVDVAADRVRQVLRNLLSNAVKYGGGGTIFVTLGASASVFSVSVSDSGPGVPDDAEALFEPFERGAFEGDGRGVGLGLALSRRIAERLGGTLSAGNRAPGGAAFTFTFVAEPAQAVAPVTVARPAAILLVEDSAPILRLLAAILARGGHATTQAATARAALASFVPGAFDLAIVDLGLPDADGLDVVAAIRARTPDTAFPIVLLTASLGGAAEAAARADPHIHVLRKPASAQAIFATIAASLDTAAPDIDVSATSPELAPLYGAARVEIVAQAERIAAAPATATPAQLHELAGLAAQFGWSATARAVEGLGAALVAGATLEEWPARILETLSIVA